MKGRLLVLVLAVALAGLGALREAKAGGGLLNNSFGTNGKLVLDISGTNDYAQAVVVQPDGKVIFGGEFTTVKGLARSSIARLNAATNSEGTLTELLVSMAKIADMLTIVLTPPSVLPGSRPDGRSSRHRRSDSGQGGIQ